MVYSNKHTNIFSISMCNYSGFMKEFALIVNRQDWFLRVHNDESGCYTHNPIV